jgi:hypothetical protein
MVLDASIHKNIMYSLQNHDPADENHFLSLQIARALYDARNDYESGVLGATGRLGDITLDVSFSGGVDLSGDIRVESITLSFPEQRVVITQPIPAIWVDDHMDGDEDQELSPWEYSPPPRVPKTATVDATMEVVVVISVNGVSETSRATYQYTGGRLSDDPPDPSDPANPSGIHYSCEAGTCHVGTDPTCVSGSLRMEFTDNGRWRLLRHETIDY